MIYLSDLLQATGGRLSGDPHARQFREFSFDSRRLQQPSPDGVLQPGMHSRMWDGRDGNLRDLGSGVYIVRMEAPGYEHVTRVTMVR